MLFWLFAADIVFPQDNFKRKSSSCRTISGRYSIFITDIQFLLLISFTNCLKTALSVKAVLKIVPLSSGAGITFSWFFHFLYFPLMLDDSIVQNSAYFNNIFLSSFII